MEVGGQLYRTINTLEPETRAKVSEPDVAEGVEEDVVGLDVAVDVAQRVDRVDGQNHLGDVKSKMYKLV